MDVKNLIPWNRAKTAPANRPVDDASPFVALHREMNRLFDDFFQGVDLPVLKTGWGAVWPRMDVEDKGNAVEVTAELPGVEQKDIEITLLDGVLSVRGEKKAETDTADYRERWFGQFQRSVQLGPDVDPDKVSATFKNGVLTVNVQKKPEQARTEKRIPINA